MNNDLIDYKEAYEAGDPNRYHMLATESVNDTLSGPIDNEKVVPLTYEDYENIMNKNTHEDDEKLNSFTENMVNSEDGDLKKSESLITNISDAGTIASLGDQHANIKQ